MERFMWSDPKSLKKRIYIIIIVHYIILYNTYSHTGGKKHKDTSPDRSTINI